jgi:hypothetical protein
MPLLLLPGGGSLATLDLSAVSADILPALGAGSFGDLDWCTQAELYNFADEAARRLAAKASVWVNRYGNQTVNPGTQPAPAPADMIDAIHISWNGASLRPASALDLESYDSGWQTAAGVPARFSVDAGLGQIFLYPAVQTTGTMAAIYHQVQPQIESGATAVRAPGVFWDYFAAAMIAGARRKESEQAMPEMADHLEQRMVLFLQIAEAYWGSAQ